MTKHFTLLVFILLVPLILFASDIELEEHYYKLGIKNLKIIKQVLKKKGILESQIDPVLRGMIRLIKTVKEEGYDFEMGPRIRIYFQKRVGLDQLQLEYVRSISIRIAQRSH